MAAYSIVCDMVDGGMIYGGIYHILKRHNFTIESSKVMNHRFGKISVKLAWRCIIYSNFNSLTLL